MVNLASIVGLRPGPQPFPYAASKAAVVNLTKTLAGRLGPEGIRVNAVAPGWMVGEWMQDQLGENYDRLMERRARHTPLRRCVTPDEVAETVSRSSCPTRSSPARSSSSTAASVPPLRGGGRGTPGGPGPAGQVEGRR